MEQGPKTPAADFIPYFRIVNAKGEDLARRAANVLRRFRALSFEDFVQGPLAQSWKFSPEVAEEIIRCRKELAPEQKIVAAAAWRLLRSVSAKESRLPLSPPREIVFLPRELSPQMRGGRYAFASTPEVGRFMFLFGEPSEHSPLSFFRLVLHEFAHALQPVHFTFHPPHEFRIVGSGIRIEQKGVLVNEAATEWLAMLLLLSAPSLPEFDFLRKQHLQVAHRIENAIQVWLQTPKKVPWWALPLGSFHLSDTPPSSPSTSVDISPAPYHWSLAATLHFGHKLAKPEAVERFLSVVKDAAVPPRIAQLTVNYGLPPFIAHLIAAAQEGRVVFLSQVAELLSEQDKAAWFQFLQFPPVSKEANPEEFQAFKRFVENLS